MSKEDVSQDDEFEAVTADDEEEGGTGDAGDVDLPDDNAEFVIEYTDDTPDLDPVEDDPTEADLEQHGRKAKQRISKLISQRDEERQSRSQAEQRERAAIEYARSVHTEKEKLQKELERQRTANADQTKGRVESQLDVAKSSYRSAYEEGDAEGMAAAQVQIARLQAEAYQLERDQAQLAALREQVEAAPPARAPQYPQQQPQQPQQHSPRLAAWLEKNRSWWQVDRVMTGTAMGLHEQLLSEGVDPDSKEYYDGLTSGMREYFPDRFSATEKRKTRAPVVAPVARSGKKARHVVTLSSSEKAVADSLGIPYETYAKQKLLKEQAND